MGLPGVGRKTANVVLSEGFKIPRIAVDTHVFRVARRLELSKAETTLGVEAVSYTHLRAHATPEHLVCRLLFEKKKYTPVSRGQ